MLANQTRHPRVRRIRHYTVRVGNGSAVTTAAYFGESPGIQVTLSRKLVPEDVDSERGLRPGVETYVKRRGGKRHVSFALSYESAIALRTALKKALDDHDQLERVRRMADVLWENYNAVEAISVQNEALRPWYYRLLSR